MGISIGGALSGGLGGFIGTGTPMGAAVGALGGGLMGGESAASAKEQMKISQAMAREQMAFQERMSSTAHQRQVADLRRAGLNPILSANKGASSPGGAMGQAQAYKQQGINTALQFAQTMAQIKQVEANTELTKAQTGAIQPVSKAGSAFGEFWDWMRKSASHSAKTIMLEYQHWKRRQKQGTGPEKGKNSVEVFLGGKNKRKSLHPRLRHLELYQ